MDCSDVIPSDIPGQLRDALIRYVKLTREKKTDVRLATDICVIVKREHKRFEYLEIARQENWPATTIAFKEIPNRVLGMYEELKQIMFVREAREQLFIWNCFEGNLEMDRWTTSQFAQIQPSKIPMRSDTWRNSRGG
ncbi:hypothetical protein JVT61DRAFT_14693 [Boletus reticuloceps]|uniref:Uncharacterized protein n=1 Tax=Boletus reticuloceps TaxID=495285 RepID=A0A8I2YRD7_9AGAM|nr:hypothetical protein JVT61DRAFT_14693 [Boletus reticuloceps]